ncbi:serine/threonine-protein kinase [Aquimonas voraii]|uniref:Serine/threonine protein kinase n=1 Tax=Aquimonas voraii TaxID=265719 RepID=A0A1G6VGN2_9GAMM|nr:serine/threonine-protein kinase [Aquimonas voraii]SDD52729.1 serine/threonine protein kinase [Aquimonas voraii]
MQRPDLATWKRLETLLDAALDLSAAEREAWLSSACPEPELQTRLRTLIAQAEAESGPLEALAARLIADVDDTRGAGRAIGSYQLESLLGEGGMAVVWRASRKIAGQRREVALKCLRRGLLSPELRQRFLQEQAILARLEHPHIATLLDAGVEPDGTPWLAMRLVEGERIDDWCNARHLDARARVRVLLDVAAAVAFAHRNLVVHRDIKPSNVLVDRDGHVRLLDFGIARLTDGSAADTTRTLHRALSPQYASPQQFEGLPASTADDAFGLGALLYVLLTGQPPRGERDAVVTDIPPSRAARPAALAAVLPETRTLRGDLDAIVLRALAPRVEDRYPSVEALMEELDRWLSGRPVRARGVGWLYRSRRFLARHWLAASLAAAALLSMSLGTWFALDRARVAEAERARAEAVQEFLLGIFEANQSDASGNYVISRREIAAEAAHRLSASDALAGKLDPALSLGLARVLHLLDLRDEAQARAQAVRDQLGPARSGEPLSIRAAVRLAALAADARDYAEAEALLREALAASRQASTRERFDIAQQLVMPIYYQQRIDEALAHSDELMRLLDSEAALSVDQRVGALLDRSVLLRGAGRLDEARALVARTLAESQAAFGPRSPKLVRVLDLKGTIDSRAGFLLDGIRAQEEAIALARTTSGSINAGRLGNLARSWLRLGHFEKARDVARHGVELRGEEFPPGHPLDFLAREPLHRAEAELGDLDGGIAFYRRWLAAGPEDSGSVRQTRLRVELAGLLRQAGEVAEAEALLQAALDLPGAIFPARGVRAAAAAQLGCLRLGAGQGEAARAAFARVRAELDPLQMEVDELLLLAECEALMQAREGALQVASDSLQTLDAELAPRLGEDSPRRARLQLLQAALLQRLGRAAAAADLAEPAQAVLERHGLAIPEPGDPSRVPGAAFRRALAPD